MWPIIATAINAGFWLLIAEGLYAIWIRQSKNAAEKGRRTKSKAKNWDSRWRWVLLGLVVLATFSRYF